MAYLTLTGDYGLDPYFVEDLPAGTIIDARTASWNLSHSDVPDPFRVYDSPNVTITGGSIWGDVSQTGEWRTVYDINYSAAVRVRWSPDAVIEDWRIDQVWDAITVRDGTTNWLVDDVYITRIRDDGLDNDHMASGTLRDSLFDGVFVGVSTDSSDAVDGHNNVVTLENTFIRMQPYLYNGELTHGPPLKTDADYPDHQPSYRFINTVIAISDVDHAGLSRTQLAWDNTIEVQNSFYLNLSDTPLPPDYPMPPAGFTVLEGQAARDYWAAVKAAWLDNHDGTPIADVTPLPGAGVTPVTPPITETPTTPQPEPAQPEPDTPTPTFSGVSYTGTNYADTIVGNNLDNLIEGKNGGDIIWGGAGNDIFLYSRGGDMDGDGKVDLYMDFTHGADKFDFSAIDANVTVSGLQDFTFVGSHAFTAPGQVRAVYRSGSDTTRVSLNSDTDDSAEYWLDVIGQHAFTEADFIF